MEGNPSGSCPSPSPHLKFGMWCVSSTATVTLGMEATGRDRRTARQELKSYLVLDQRPQIFLCEQLSPRVCKPVSLGYWQTNAIDNKDSDKLPSKGVAAIFTLTSRGFKSFQFWPMWSVTIVTSKWVSWELPDLVRLHVFTRVSVLPPLRELLMLPGYQLPGL